MVKPIDISRKLNISTSALRHYESWGIVPKAERRENGYRMYTDEHVAYFECIRAMQAGFGMEVVRTIMPLIMQKNEREALWIVNGVQVSLHNEKQQAELALQALEKEEQKELSTRYHKKWYTIGETAKTIDVPSSTLRHWEKEGLITPERSFESGYRMYSPSDLRKLLIIRTLQSSVYSLETVREAMEEVDQHNSKNAIKVLKDSLIHMDNLIKERLRGFYYLYQLLEKVKE